MRISLNSIRLGQNSDHLVSKYNTSKCWEYLVLCCLLIQSSRAGHEFFVTPAVVFAQEQLREREKGEKHEEKRALEALKSEQNN